MSLSTSRIILRLATRSMSSNNSTLFSLEMLWKQLCHTRSYHRKSLIRCDINPKWRQRALLSSSYMSFSEFEKYQAQSAAKPTTLPGHTRLHNTTQHKETQHTRHDTYCFQDTIFFIPHFLSYARQALAYSCWSILLQNFNSKRGS